MIMAKQWEYRDFMVKYALIIIIGLRYSGVEEICKTLLQSGRIKHLECTKIERNVNYIRQEFRISNTIKGSDDVSSDDMVHSEYLADGRLRIPNEGLLVVVKSNRDSVIERWAAENENLIQDDQRARRSFSENFRNTLRSLVKYLQSNEASKQLARENAWTAYVEEEMEMEMEYAKMKKQPCTHSLEVYGDDVAQAVEKVCAEWKAMQRCEPRVEDA
jgi:adenosine deaminase